MNTLQMTKHSPLKKLFLVGGLLAVTWVSMALQPKDANAEIRVRANIHTPVGRVVVDTAPRYQHVVRPHRPRPVVVRSRPHFVSAKFDRRVAKRLERLTGYSKHELLDLRAAGYSWSRIGRLLRIDPVLIDVALDHHRFQRYVSRGRSRTMVCTGR